MNPDLQKYFEKQRAQVCVPREGFPERVLARWNARGPGRELQVWDFVPGSVRPVLLIGVLLLGALGAVSMLDPTVADRDAVEAALEFEAEAPEGWIFGETESPERSELLEQVLVAEQER